MGLREAVDRYANAVSSRDYWDDRGQAEKSRQRGLEAEQARQCLDALIDEAEAALAHAEYQVKVHSYAPVDSATYIRERTELWDAYMAARAKAKSIT